MVTLHWNSTLYNNNNVDNTYNSRCIKYFNQNTSEKNTSFKNNNGKKIVSISRTTANTSGIGKHHFYLFSPPLLHRCVLQMHVALTTSKNQYETCWFCKHEITIQNSKFDLSSATLASSISISLAKRRQMDLNKTTKTKNNNASHFLVFLFHP